MGRESWVVALEFGTTATAAAIRTDGGPVAELVLPDGASTMSSPVFAEDDGQLVVGADADNESQVSSAANEFFPTPQSLPRSPQPQPEPEPSGHGPDKTGSRLTS